MKLITAAIRKKLEANYAKTCETGESGNVVLKLFGGSGMTWLITEIEPNNDTLWGLADIGMGCCEFGTISLSELESLKFQFGLGVERDMHFSEGSVESFKDYCAKNNSLNGC